MKTLHFTNAYHPTSGGIRHFYDALLAAAGRTNLRVRLIVPSETSGVEDLNPNARIYRVRAPRSLLFDRRYRVLLPTQVLAPQGAIVRILREEQPDLVEVCDRYSLCYLAGALRKGWIAGVRRPVLVGLSCERMDDNVASYLGLGAIGRMLSSVYMRRIYMPQFDHHVANSQYTAGELRRQARKHPRSVRVVPMGVEADRFSPARRNPALRFVHPNPREPFGIAPLEAMASGLPLVAPTTGGVTTYATDETAWLASSTPEHFAARIREVFRDPELRVAKVERALNVARQYRWESVAGQFFETYEQLVGASTAFTDSPLMTS